MNHIGDTNKMVSDTPRTDAGLEYDDTTVDDVKGFARQLEREINAANSEVYRLCKANLQLREGAEEQKQRIQSLIEERDRANRLAEWKWNLRDEFQLLLGTDKIEEGIEVVNELKRRIKRLEEAGDAMAIYAELGGIPLQFVGVVNAWREAKEAKP